MLIALSDDKMSFELPKDDGNGNIQMELKFSGYKFNRRFLFQTKNAQLDMSDLDVVAKELDQISGSFSANYIPDIRKKYAMLTGYTDEDDNPF